MKKFKSRDTLKKNVGYGKKKKQLEAESRHRLNCRPAYLQERNKDERSPSGVENDIKH